MDVVPDADLLNFVDNLEEKEEESNAAWNTNVLNFVVDNIEEKPLKEEPSVGAWSDIYEALDRWSQSILDAESSRDKTENIRLKIENVIHRQQIDGLLSHFDATELRYVTDLWIRLLHAITSFDIGCTSTKRGIITLMLELYTLNQLHQNVFIETCLKLW